MTPTKAPKKAKAGSGPKPMACRECKKQKIYCSKGHPKCKRCQVRSIECVYAGPKKIKVNEQNLRLLKAKLRHYEEIIKTLPVETRAALPEDATAAAAEEERTDEEEGTEDDESDGSVSEQLQQMSLYLQTSGGSADNFIRTARTLSGVSGDDGGLDQHRGFYHPRVLPSRRRGVHRDVALPPIDIARQYFAAQHMYIGTIFAFMGADAFERQLRDVYRGDVSPGAADGLAYAKFLVILALGRLYSVNQHVASGPFEVQDDPPGLAYFVHALEFLPDIHEECSILGVETLAYVGYFMQNMNRRDAAFLYVGIALRMAISLGLHQEVPGDSLSAAEREHRRRVWWSIYSLDRILSLKSGNPIAIADADIGVRMPARLPGEAEDSPVVVLRNYTELSRILGDITALVYRRTAHTAASLTAAVHAILASLTRWEEALPFSLKLELDRGKLSRESISVFLHYYQCINMTVRPLLFHVVQRRLALIRAAAPAARPAEKERDWRAGLARKTASIVGGCISAARNTLLVMARAAEFRMVATYGYMDGEHAISAAVVLALVCGTFPHDPANADCLAKGLALLHDMGRLGNSHVAARHRLLVHLQGILARLTGAVPDAGGPETSAAPASLDSPAGFPECFDAQISHLPGLDALESTYLGFDFANADVLGLLPDLGSPEDADTHLWTKAFANPVSFDISQLIPDANMTDYGSL